MRISTKLCDGNSAGFRSLTEPIDPTTRGSKNDADIKLLEEGLAMPSMTNLFVV